MQQLSTEKMPERFQQQRMKPISPRRWIIDFAYTWFILPVAPAKSNVSYCWTTRNTCTLTDKTTREQLGPAGSGVNVENRRNSDGEDATNVNSWYLPQVVQQGARTETRRILKYWTDTTRMPNLCKTRNEVHSLFTPMLADEGFLQTCLPRICADQTCRNRTLLPPLLFAPFRAWGLAGKLLYYTAFRVKHAYPTYCVTKEAFRSQGLLVITVPPVNICMVPGK